MSIGSKGASPSQRTIGWIEAAAFVLVIAILNVVYAVAQQNGVHVTVFVLYATGFAALGMLAIAGPGKNAASIMTARESWVFGSLTIAMEAFYFLLLGVVTPAEAALTVRLSIPASLLVGWLFFSRGMNKRTALGAAIVIAAVIPIFASVGSGEVLAAVFLASVCSAIVAFKTFASEFHPWNRAAETVVDKLRVTGLVVLATALAGSAVILPGVALVEAGAIEPNGLIPAAQAFTHGPTLILALALGAPLLLAMNYLTFSSIVKISTENFLAMSAFGPLGALLAQTIAMQAGLLQTVAFEWWLIPIIALGIAGVLIIIRSRPRIQNSG